MRNLTRSERQQIHALVYQCANYDRPERNCLLLDTAMGRRVECPMLNVVTAGKVCSYFRAAVLPLNPMLEAALCYRPINSKRCAICGKDFIPKANRAQYCSEKCQREGRLRTKREWAKQNKKNDRAPLDI